MGFHIQWRFALMLTCTLICCAAGKAMGQSTCTLKLAELPAAPELVGFRLGMTTAEVKTRVPQISFGNANDLGLAKITINPDFDSRFDKSTFNGVRSVSMEFLDAKLTSLWVGYDSSFKWKSVDDFVKGISHSLHLPNSWQTWRVRGQQLRCADFTMTVSIIAEGPSFRIVDETAVNTLAQRREAKDAEASAESESEETAKPQNDSEEIIADKKSKTYFTVTCLPARPIAEKDRVVFKTIEAAEQAGFKRSTNCQQ